MPGASVRTQITRTWIDIDNIGASTHLLASCISISQQPMQGTALDADCKTAHPEIGVADIHDDPPSRGEREQSLDRRATLHDRAQDANTTERTQCRRMQKHPCPLGARWRVAIEMRYPAASTTQLQRSGDPGGAVADDGYVQSPLHPRHSVCGTRRPEDRCSVGRYRNDAAARRQHLRRLDVPRQPQASQHSNELEPEVALARVQPVTR